MTNVLIIGATSAIAQATARLYAKHNCIFHLIARNPERLTMLENDLAARGAGGVTSQTVDVNDSPNYGTIVENGFNALNTVDICLIAHGTLPDQAKCQQDIDETINAININSLSTIAFLTEIANRMEKQQKGTIAVITSVAGDRGRQSNYVYGSAKAMVSTFLQGLRNRLYRSGVNVVDIKPGFVDTPMTAEFSKGALWSKPEIIAKKIHKSIKNHNQTVYAPGLWYFILLIIRLIPEFLFNRLKL